MNDNPIVGIKCLAYNHAKTIRQTLDGFVNQQTEYKYIAVVHDDASTDGTSEIIMEYAIKYPDIIKPIIEKVNVYQNSPKGTLEKIMNEALKNCKYIALCEGDDYWISTDKLQRQVSFLETHPEYSMCCTDGEIITNEGIKSWTISSMDIDLKTENIITEGGLYIITAGIIYRTQVKEDYPLACKNCHVGDYPLQIMCGLKGKVRYISEKMVAYRYEIGDSWTSKRKLASIDKIINSSKSEINMLEELNKYSNLKHQNSFKEREANYILGIIYDYLECEELNKIYKNLIEVAPDCVRYTSLKNQVLYFMVRYKLTFIWKWIKTLRIKLNSNNR